MKIQGTHIRTCLLINIGFLLLAVYCKKDKDDGKDVDVAQKGMKQNADKCDANEECQSTNCHKGNCAPLKCRNDKTCIKAGLKDHYCRRRTIFKVFASECVTKRGITLISNSNLQ